VDFRAFVRSVPVQFDWAQSSGFKSISAESPFGSPFSHLIAVQAKLRIAPDLAKAGWRSAKGRLNVRVFCWLFVLGVDHYNAWNVEIIDPEVTPLMHAVENGDTASAMQMIAKGANVNAQDQRGWTALMHASMKGQTNETRLLLAAGADPNLRDREGRTAFLWAAWNCRSEVAEVLIDSGADVNVKDRFGNSAMSSTPCPGVVQDLLKRAKNIQESVDPKNSNLRQFRHLVSIQQSSNSCSLNAAGKWSRRQCNKPGKSNRRMTERKAFEQAAGQTNPLERAKRLEASLQKYPFV